MSLQTRACFKKEILAFLRTKKFFIILAVILGWSILGPLMIRGLGFLMDAMSPIYDDFGMDVSEMTAALTSTVSIGVSSSISDMSVTGLIVFLLLINSFAGGEQKRRSTIIPQSSGLRTFSYIFPKFIVYPLVGFVLAIAGVFVSYLISALVFDVNDVSVTGVFLGGVISGVCLMFYICFHITIGTATGKAGMSAAICIVSSMLLPQIFAILGAEFIYNPFTLSLLAAHVIYDAPLIPFLAHEIAMTVLIALAIMVVVYFVALFVQNAKKIDNSGNEIRL